MQASTNTAFRPIFHVCAARAAPSRIVAGFLDASGSVTTKAGPGPADQPRLRHLDNANRTWLERYDLPRLRRRRTLMPMSAPLSVVPPSVIILPPC